MNSDPLSRLGIHGVVFGVWFSKNDRALVTALDGTIYLVEASSRKILWSFSSGSSIYSSYQAFLGGDNDKQLSNDFFIDCGDDWQLYRHNISFGKRVYQPIFYIYAFWLRYCMSWLHK